VHFKKCTSHNKVYVALKILLIEYSVYVVKYTRYFANSTKEIICSNGDWFMHRITQYQISAHFHLILNKRYAYFGA